MKQYIKKFQGEHLCAHCLRSRTSTMKHEASVFSSQTAPLSSALGEGMQRAQLLHLHTLYYIKYSATREYQYPSPKTLPVIVHYFKTLPFLFQHCIWDLPHFCRCSNSFSLMYSITLYNYSAAYVWISCWWIFSLFFLILSTMLPWESSQVSFLCKFTRISLEFTAKVELATIM